MTRLEPIQSTHLAFVWFGFILQPRQNFKGSPNALRPISRKANWQGG